MISLAQTLDYWDTDQFQQVLKHELEQLEPGTLPLTQATQQGGLVDDTDISVTVISAQDQDRSILARVGVFFTEIVGGCSCGDEPMACNNYCDLELSIDKQTGLTSITILEDSA